MERTDGRENWQGARPRESGMILVAAMLILALLSVLSLAGISSSSLEVKIAGNDRESKQAFFLCEAGLETAKYQIVKGWGKGTGGGTGPWTFTFDSATVPPSMAYGEPFEWLTDRWVNFTLVDSRGVGYRIEAHDTVYAVTDCTGPADAPADGYARILYDDNGVAESYSGTVSGTDFTVTPSPGWAVNQWVGFELRAPNAPPPYLPIVGNTAETITFVGGPPAGTTLEIIRAVGSANTFTLHANPEDTDEPGAPNAAWRSNGWDLAGHWFLRDSNGDVFAITATSYPSDQMLLTVAGTPASGPFQLVASPWLDWLRVNGPLTYTPATPSGISYGSVDLSVSASTPTNGGRYTLAAASISTTTGNAKEIEMDVQLGERSRTLVRDWRLVR